MAVAVRRIDARARALPDFVVIGAQKAGTTTLYAQIVANASVLPALRKEVHYFDAAPRPLGWYRAFFPREARVREVARRTGSVHVGEATPFYLCHPAAPTRMRAVVPYARLIAILREPVSRAVSGYHHAVRMGDETRAIHVALDPEHADELATPADTAWYDDPRCPIRRRGYLVRGHYAEQLARWLAVYPRDQLLVLDTTELAGGVAAARALDFLGVSGTGGAPLPNRNVGHYDAVPDRVRRRLADHFAPHNARLWELLGESWEWPA